MEEKARLDKTYFKRKFRKNPIKECFKKGLEREHRVSPPDFLGQIAPLPQGSYCKCTVPLVFSLDSGTDQRPLPEGLGVPACMAPGGSSWERHHEGP